MGGRLKRFWWLLKRAFVASYEDGCFAVAKGAAYSALLSFIPVLTALAAILVQFNAERVSRILSEFLFVVVPPGTEDLVQYGFEKRGERPVYLLVTATLLSLWAASGVMATLMEGFQSVYRIPNGRPWVRQRLVAIGLVLIGAAPVLLASALLLLGGWIERWVLTALGFLAVGEQVRGWVLVVGTFVRYGVSLGAIAMATAGLFYFGPNRRQQWSAVWPGALLSTNLWLISTICFAWYVRNIANYNVMYGSIGAVIAMLVWMYVLAVIALVGCEYNAVRERMLQRR